MQAFNTLVSKTVALRAANIDTDQIIPARFLKVTDKEGMGDHAFADWRYHPDGSPKTDFPLNQERARDAQILVAGHNFGCGSSREHAPWALLGLGLRVVISTEIADIFRNNSLKNGLLVLALDPKVHSRLTEVVSDDPQAEIGIDLEACTIELPWGETVAFEIDAFARRCLLEGVDQLGYLVDRLPAIEAFEASRPVRVDTRNGA
jgi:3-isopropylmalate/(R)-2-methylmalate dehydratase small subunit